MSSIDTVMEIEAEAKEMKDDKNLTADELQKLIDVKNRERLQACKSEIDAILEKYNCEFLTVPRVSLDKDMKIKVETITSIQLRR